MAIEHKIHGNINASSIDVGANINLTTTAINVGNSTVNTVITAGSITVNGAPIGAGGGGANLEAVSTNIVPSANVTYDLGTSTMRWRDLYLSGTTIDVGGALIQADDTSGSLAFVPKPTEGNPNPIAAVISPDGLKTVSTTGGVVSANDITQAVVVDGSTGKSIALSILFGG